VSARRLEERPTGPLTLVVSMHREFPDVKFIAIWPGAEESKRSVEGINGYPRSPRAHEDQMPLCRCIIAVGDWFKARHFAKQLAGRALDGGQ
jgi:hypothetical protein